MVRAVSISVTVPIVMIIFSVLVYRLRAEAKKEIVLEVPITTPSVHGSGNKSMKAYFISFASIAVASVIPVVQKLIIIYSLFFNLQNTVVYKLVFMLKL